VRSEALFGTALVRPGELGFRERQIMGGAAALLVATRGRRILWPKAIAWPLARSPSGLRSHS